MKILFQLIPNREKFHHFFDQNYLEVNRAYISNRLGHAQFWVLDDYGNVICSFDNMLLDLVCDLAAGYSGLMKRKVTRGGVYVMEAENDGETHFWFQLEGEKFNFYFKAHDTVSLSKGEFHGVLGELSDYAFKTIEYHFQGIKNNPNYLEWRSEVVQFLV